MHVFQKIDVTMTSILKTKTRICNEKGRFLKNQMTVLQGDFVFLHGFKKTVFFPICDLISDFEM